MSAHPALPGEIVDAGSLADREHTVDVHASRSAYEGWVDVRIDEIDTGAGTAERTVVEHVGAVGVVALDDEGRVLLLEQYRHAVGRRLLEIPAGLLDVEDEPPVDAALRELGEETDVAAGRCDELVALWSSPGFTDEHWTVFLARDLTPLPIERRTERQHEEAGMRVVWVPLADAVTAVLDGRLQDSMAIAGLLATDALLRRNEG